MHHNSSKFPFPDQRNSLHVHYTRTQIDTQKLSLTKGKAVTLTQSLFQTKINLTKEQ